MSDTQHIKIDEDDAITPKEVYKELWEGRNFELSHLWQRSVFLAVFMLAIAGAYGTIVHDMLFSERNYTVEVKRGDRVDNTIESKINDVTNQQHLLAMGVCLLGMTFSILWILMAKGSKRCFEEYENGINWFV